jgi:hypothetical protein
MERFVQYMDDVEDLIYAFALKWERIRRAFRFTLFVASSVLLQIFAIFLALSTPPLAVAVAALLLVGLLHKAVISYSAHSAIST